MRTRRPRRREQATGRTCISCVSCDLPFQKLLLLMRTSYASPSVRNEAECLIGNMVKQRRNGHSRFGPALNHEREFGQEDKTHNHSCCPESERTAQIAGDLEPVTVHWRRQTSFLEL